MGYSVENENPILECLVDQLDHDEQRPQGKLTGLALRALQAGIEFKKNLRERFGNYGGLKLEYFWVVKSKKAKSFIRG